MSQENVELVREMYEAFQSRDYERTFDFYDPEIELDATRVGELIPDQVGVYRGYEGVRIFWRRWLSHGETFNSRSRIYAMPVRRW